MSDKTPDILIPALRQYQHNDCSGLLAGFDYDETVKIVTNLQQQILDICQPRCEWKMSNDGFYDVWESTCGNSFVLNDGSPEDNEMNYCSHCGGKLIQPIPEDTA